MKTNHLALFIVLTAFLSGCVTIERIPFEADAKKQVEVFFDRRPERKYAEVGYYTAYGTAFHSHKRVLRRLREKAKKDGVDALINVTVTYTFFWPTITGLAVKYEN